MAVANENAVKYASLTDEHIKDIKVGIEKYVESEEYWDGFANHSKVPKGHKVFSSRILVAPVVKEADITTRAEFVAPRPTKITVKTVERTVENYGDKAIYSREDLQYHFDDTVANIRSTLQEIAVQKLDLLKGKSFVSTRATVAYDTSILNTSEKAAIILRKNKAKRWADGLYLAHITPEEYKQLRYEISQRGAVLSEPTKVMLDGKTHEVFKYGDYMWSVTTSEVMYASDTAQRIIFMGKRGVDGASPVDVAKLEGESNIEVINNGLGSGVLVDVDGNYTSDDNKQQGSVAINMDGLGAAVSDDLCILLCDNISINEIKGTALPETEKTGFVSMSGNFVELELDDTNLTHAEYKVDGYAKYEESTYYGAGSTLVKVQVKAASGYTLGDVTASTWSALYNTDKSAEIVAIFKTVKNNDTAIIRVPNNPAGAKLTIGVTATGAA